MRPERYHPDALRSLLRQEKIATMDELKAALGSAADATVFRKLAELGYRTSYSHRGRYYTLDEIARFDELGLCSFRQVFFSRFGTLVSTVEALVSLGEACYDAAELETVVNVEVKAALLKLVRSGRLFRQEVSGRFCQPRGCFRHAERICRWWRAGPADRGCRWILTYDPRACPATGN